VKAFARFWYDFVVGDDWTIAVGVVVVLGVTWLVTHAGLSGWWWTTLAVVALLGGSVWRASRRR
jgi:hypothetical protein